MKIRNLGAAALAMLAIGAVTASSASALATETEGEWLVKGVGLAAGESRTTGCSKDPEFPIVIVSKVGAVTVELTAEGVECLEGKIEQVAVGAKEFARGSGKLKFTGVSVVQPAACKTNATLTTNALTTQVMMDVNLTYDRFRPTVGETIATIPLTKCAIAGNYPLKGEFFGLFAWGLASIATGAEGSPLPLEFRGEINEWATGAANALRLAAEPATFSTRALTRVEGLEYGVTE